MKKQTKSKRATKTRRAPKPDAAAPATWPENKPKVRERDPRLPAAGTTLTRTYKGRDLRVSVLDDGFRFEGAEFRSLSALAAHITGFGAVNGYLWFGLTKRPAAPKMEPAKETPAAAAKKTRAPKAKRAGRDPKPEAQGETAIEAAPGTEAVAPTA